MSLLLAGIASIYKSKKSNAGPIAGGIGGGVALLFLIILSAVIWKLRRRTSALQEIQEGNNHGFDY
jgi:hypothetical protein